VPMLHKPLSNFLPLRLRPNGLQMQRHEITQSFTTLTTFFVFVSKELFRANLLNSVAIDLQAVRPKPQWRGISEVTL
jgi:hypothetical protein